MERNDAPAIVIPSERSESRNPHRAEVQSPFKIRVPSFTTSHEASLP